MLQVQITIVDRDKIGTKVVDILVYNSPNSTTQQFHSFFISVPLNALNPPTPKSILYVMKVKVEGLKHNIDFRARGWRYTGGGDR